MKIYNSLGVEILDVAVTDDSYRYRAIMGENALTIMFSMVSYIDIPVGSYVDYQASRYTLLKPQNFTKNNTRYFEYTLILDGPEAVLSWFKLRDFSGRLKFSHTAKPQEHLQLLVDNLNERDSGWSIGSYVDSVEKVISFNHTSCNDALRQMAEAFNTEYEIIGKQISLRRVEYNKANPLALSYGFGNGFKSGVKRENSGDSKAIEILYVQGGERNISPTIYGSQELLLPKSKTLKFDGSKFEGEAGFVLSASREYVSSADGAFIKRNDKPLSNKIEDSLDCSNIYPSRVGVVSGVEEISSAQNFYDILDNQIPATLDYHECLIEGEKMTIVFQSGMLAGREFDCSYVHNDRRFKIVPQEIDGVIMPSGSYLPQIGDSYAIFGIQLPTDYISNDSTKTGASWDMFREAVRYMYSNEESKFTFSGELDPMWASTDWVNIGGKIKLGGFVSFTDSQFQTTPALIRIVGVRDYINNPHKPQIELSNVTSGGGYGSALKDIANTETIIENAKKEVVRFAKRGFREAKETAKMLENSLLNFSGAINPVTVQTMQLLVGDESLQFEFVSNQNSTAPIPHNETFNPATKQFTSAAGIIQHKTLGITDVSSSRTASDYKWWSLPEYVSAVLDQQGKSYYLYAKVSKTNNTGTFILSETAIAIEQVSGFYHLLVGILNSESDGDRSYSPMYGYSELTPGRLMIKKLISPSGNVYFDLDKGNGDGEIAGNIKFRASDNSLKTVEQAIDEVEVGGRNYIRNSKSLYRTIYPAHGIVYSKENGVDKLVASAGNGNYANIFWGLDFINQLKDEACVFSFEIKSADSVLLPTIYQEDTGYIALNGTLSDEWSAVSASYLKYQNGRAFHLGFSDVVGTYYLRNYKLEKGNKPTDWSPAPEDIQLQIAETNSYIGAVESDLQNQIDGQIIAWFKEYSPTLINEPASLWTTADEKNRHANDTFTNTLTGASWRWQYVGGAWQWGVIADTATQQALLAASKAQDTADSKRRTFTAQPLTSQAYDVGDLWVNATVGTFTNDLLKCKTAKAVGVAFNVAHWEKASKYTDDTAVQNLKPAGKNYLIGSRTDSLVGWIADGGTMSVVTDPQFGKVVEYSRPAGGGDFMKSFQIDVSELKNTELVYYCIAKPISGTTIFNFGGWQETFTMLNNNSPYRDLGNGWRMYYKVFTAGNSISTGGSFGLNSVGGTWRFHSFGVAKGNTPPSDWDASPKEIDFLKQGYKASTDIEGGVVQTAVLLLRNALEQVTAGISGLGGDNVINWGAGTYQDAINDAAKTFGAAMVTSFLNKDDGGGHLAFGKIAWNNAGLLKVIGNIEALSGKIGNFKISDGAIIGYDTNGVARLKVSPINVPALSSIISISWVDLNSSNLDNSVNGDVYSDSEYIETFAREIVTTQDFTIPIAAKVTTETNAQYQAQGYEYIDSFYTTVKYYQGQTLISTQSGYSTLPAGTYRVEVRSVLTFTVQGHSSAAYDIAHTDSRIRYEGAIKQTEFGLNGMYSVFSPTEYFHFREGSGLSVRGATDIPAGLGGASISGTGSVFANWGKIDSTGKVVKSGSNYTITHNIGDTNYSLILTPISTNVPYFSSKSANTVVVTCAGGFDFVLIRTK